MEEIGVEAIVKGLASFIGDMKKMDKSISDLVPTNTLLGRAFHGLGDIISSLAGGAVRILEFALGSLLASAIRGVISLIGELISGAIEAGGEFQKLELRLNRLNFNTLIESGADFDAAQKQSIIQTKEQLTWLQKIANTTPYDNEDIASVYTLARAYSFTDGEAQNLTQDTIDFASGMGLGSVEIERIMKNFGQMRQLGKIMQRDLNDLATGAFVPVNDVLALMQKQTGKTGKAFEDFKKTGEGVDAFMRAFSTLVEERFGGAARIMARTFGAATDNAKDLIKSLLGLNVVKPVLDVIGGKVADFMDTLTKPISLDIGGVDSGGFTTRFDEMVKSASRIGEVISSIIQRLLDLGPSAEGIADSVVSALDNIATWLEDNEDGIVEFFIDMGDKIKTTVTPIIEKVVEAFNKLTDWVSENRGTIGEFFTTLGEIVGDVFEDITGGVDVKDGGGGILESITAFMKYVIENKDEITKWVEILIKVFVIWQVLSTIFAFVGGLISGLIGFVIGAVLAFASFLTILSGVWSVLVFIGGIISGIGIPILALIGLVILLALIWAKVGDQVKVIVSQLAFIIDYYMILIATRVGTTFGQLVFLAQEHWNATVASIVSALTKAIAAINKWRDDLVKKVKDAFNAVRAIKWVDIGRGIIDGIVGYVKSHIGELAGAIAAGIAAAIAAAKAALESGSPSAVFMDIGKGVMDGFALGISRNAETAADAMRKAVGTMAMPAMGAPALAFSAAMMPASTTTNNTNNNYNLNINTQARAEPIMMDFNMLKSLGV